MWKAMLDKFSLVTGDVKKAVLRSFSRDLMGDQASSPSHSQQEMAMRSKTVFDLKQQQPIHSMT